MMFSASYIIAASQLFAIAFGAPLLNSNAKEARSLVERSAYKVFGGDGTVAQGWPDQKDWKSFEDLWTANEPTMKSSCTQFNMDNDSDAEIADIKKAITSVADQSKLPAEFILAIMMQESKGCVRAPTTNYGYNNPGLMQSFQGAHSCNPSGSGTVPCPSDTITGMISDGAGIGLEAGLTQSITQSKADDVSKFYKGARIYNSGSVDSSGNLGAGIATHCYATDVANRLIGWAEGETGCQEGSIGSVQGSSGGAGNGDGNGQTSDPPKQNDPPATPAAGGNSPSGPKADGAASGCTKWYDVKAGDTCSSTGIAVDQLVKLNTSLKSDCSNLFAGTSYCVAA